MSSKHRLQHGMTNLNYLMDQILSDIQDYFEIILKKNIMKVLIIHQ